MSKVCIDCAFYKSGGFCRKRNRDVGALSEICNYFISIDKKDHMDKTGEYTQTKTCTKCGRELPLSSFGVDKKSKDNLKYWCKQCMTNAALAARKKRKAREADNAKTVVREVLTDQQMVMALRARGWTVTCTRTITEEL